ncbi:MAG: hypothetical protein M0020_08055 [Actinomycetota bacterium]|nr:hypothetical protein [Actinomycetota bacterium]
MGQVADHPGHAVSVRELLQEGFVALELEVRAMDVEFPFGSGCEWTTLGAVPKGPGVYAFTVGHDDELHVAYVGMTEDLWMVTKGRLPSGEGRPGQRYGRPLYAGATRQRINGLVREQLLLGKNIRHWVSLLANPPSAREELRSQLLAREEMLIRRWDLRRVGWNLG